VLSCANWRKLSTPAEADKIGRFSRYQCIGKTQISADISARLIYRSISRCKYSALMLINCWTLAQQVSNFLTLRVVWYREQHFSADVVYYYCETTTTLCLVPCRIAAYAASSNLKQAIEGWFKQNVTHGIVAQELVSFITMGNLRLCVALSLNQWFSIFLLQWPILQHNVTLQPLPKISSQAYDTQLLALCTIENHNE